MKRYISLILILLLIIGLGIFLVFYWINDDYSNTAIEAINNQRGKDSVNYLIHGHQVEDGELIFYLRNVNDGQIVVSFEYLTKTSRGWKWINGGEHSSSEVSLDNPGESTLGKPITYQFVGDLKKTKNAEQSFSIIYGIILDPDIYRIVIKDYINGMEKQASIVTIRDKFNLYYVLLDSNQGQKFDIVAYSIDGKEIFRETIIGNQNLHFEVKTNQGL